MKNQNIWTFCNFCEELLDLETPTQIRTISQNSSELTSQLIRLQTRCKVCTWRIWFKFCIRDLNNSSTSYSQRCMETPLSPLLSKVRHIVNTFASCIIYFSALISLWHHTIFKLHHAFVFIWRSKSLVGFFRLAWILNMFSFFSCVNSSSACSFTF